MTTEEKVNLLGEIKLLKFEIEDLKMALEKHIQVIAFLLKQRNWYKSKIGLFSQAVEELETNCHEEQTRADLLADELSKVSYSYCTRYFL